MGIIRFGPDGWRARVGEGFDESSVVRIACALGSTWRRSAPGATVLVGYDTRRDSERLALRLGEVIASYGLQVGVSDHVCPTPALGWAVARDPACIGGVMLTASEASHEYGGVLIRQADGGPISERFADLIEQSVAISPTQARGTVERINFVDAYKDALLAPCDTRAIAAWSPRIVVDAMHGAGAGLAAEVFSRAGCEVIAIHDEAARDFRGLHPDPREPWVDACEQAVLEHGARMGLVFDGDCDRMALIDATGYLVTPHMLAPLVLEQVVAREGRQGRVVATSTTSARIERQAERLGLDFTMVPRGVQTIYRELAVGDCILAADEDGGVCLPSHLFERDGLACALALVEMVGRSGGDVRTVGMALARELGPLEYGRLDIRLDHASVQRLYNLLPGINPPDVAGMRPEAISHADGFRVTLPGGSWLSVRADAASSTLAVRAEAPSAVRLSELLQWARGLV